MVLQSLAMLKGVTARRTRRSDFRIEERNNTMSDTVVRVMRSNSYIGVMCGAAVTDSGAGLVMGITARHMRRRWIPVLASA